MTDQSLAIVVLISGNGSNLQAIIDSQQSHHLNVDIKAVISSKPHAYGLQRASAANIPNVCIKPSDFANRQDYDQALTDQISQYNPDLIVLAGFMRILGDQFVNQFKNKIINIHPSLLPNYPGLNTHSAVMADQAAEHGCSIHFVNNELDGGPVIAQAVVTVKRHDSIESLQAKVHQAEHFLYPTVLNWFASKRLQLKNNQVYFDDIPLPNSGFQFKINEYL